MYNSSFFKRREFSKGFLWGSSTASFQVEGGIDNNDWAAAAREGKVPIAGTATDHYNRFPSDFDIAKNLGQNAHRLSIEWSRVEPEEGQFDEGEIAHYAEVLGALKARGIEPMVTLWHFTVPIWFTKQGGFASPDAPQKFARYCTYVVSRLHGGARLWMTMNEPMVYASNSFYRGKWPPFRKNFFTYLGVINTLIESHKLAYSAIKKVWPKLEIGIAKNNIDFDSDHNPLNKIKVRLSRWFWNHRFLRRIRHHQDFIGLNYYMHVKYGKHSHETSDMGWHIYPKGIFYTLEELMPYGKPIYITENGIADATDQMRSSFIKDHLFWVAEAVRLNIPVKGYFYWSLLDNYEWAHGFTKRFGLVSVDYDTMKRTVRSSAYDYKIICERNSL